MGKVPNAAAAFTFKFEKRGDEECSETERTCVGVVVSEITAGPLELPKSHCKLVMMSHELDPGGTQGA